MNHAPAAVQPFQRFPLTFAHNEQAKCYRTWQGRITFWGRRKLRPAILWYKLFLSFGQQCAILQTGPFMSQKCIKMSHYWMATEASLWHSSSGKKQVCGSTRLTMNTSIRKYLMCFAGASSLLLASQAGASLVETFTTTTPVPATLTDWSSTLSFAQFNPALGTLNSVTLDFSSTLNTTLTINNSGSLPSDGSAWTRLRVTVQDGGLNLTAPEITLLSPEFVFSIGAGQSTSSGLLTTTGTRGDTYTLAAVLAEFTGTGNISLPASTKTRTVLDYEGGNSLASQVSFASLTGTVTYNYTPVPEPTTMITGALLLLLMFGTSTRRILWTHKANR